MSSGVFETRKYQSTKTGLIHPIKVQPETLTTLTLNSVANAEPAGALSNPVSAQVSQGKRSLGLNARLVTITWVGAPPTNYKAGGNITLPWLASAGFDALVRGVTGTYLGTPVRVVGTREEKAN